ncbi:MULTISPECIES: TIR domain-containing protein [Bacillus]|uniref:TIR domain-containing protein n=1 Tax=Bacillus TaxID=1386 RepID=UPI00119CE534|nr:MULTISPECIES: TIR domain-containing protein [Bacillus]
MARKVFVSYHHGKDQSRANYLRTVYGRDNTLIDRSLPEALDSSDNDYILSIIRTRHLKNSTVTIVLVGEETYKRKWVDWEIYSSLRTYSDRTRNGLLAIMLPGANVVPARLQDNIDSGYAVMMRWENISHQLESKIEEAYSKRQFPELVKNWRPRRVRNG